MVLGERYDEDTVVEQLTLLHLLRAFPPIDITPLGLDDPHPAGCVRYESA